MPSVVILIVMAPFYHLLKSVKQMNGVMVNMDSLNLSDGMQAWGTRKLTGDNLKVAWAEFLSLN